MHCRRVVITRPGGADVLRMVTDPLPEPGPGEVCVKVLAAGVARADIMMRRGQYPGEVPPYPYAPGYDIAGEVHSLGEDVQGLEVGQLVAALTGVGGYAEYLCVPAAWLVPVPEGLDPAEVVSLVLNYLTAYQMMHRFASVREGERILVHAAASGVGTALLQLGRLLDLRMWGTASAGKHPVVESLGAIPIDYRSEDFVRRVRREADGGVDAAFDPVGGGHLWRSYRALRFGGRLIAFGEMALTGPGKPAWSERVLHTYLPRVLNYLPGGRTVRWYEVFDENREHPDWYRHDLAMLIELLEAGKIRPVIAERMPLAEAARAHELIEGAAVSGKIVLMCQE